MATYNLRASEVPAIQVETTVPDTEAATPAPLVSSSITNGMHALQLAQRFNRNALLSDLVSRDGGGGPAIIAGAGGELALSAGSGLTLSVATGRARISGAVSLTAAGSLALANNSRCYVYLLADGSLTYVANSTTPPNDPCVYLGQVTTAAGAIGNVDRSGVLEARGPLLYRQTGDAADPDDEPPASLAIWTLTQGGLYLWEGSEHRLMGSDESLALDLATEIALREDLERRFQRLVVWMTCTLDDCPPELLADLEMGAAAL